MLMYHRLALMVSRSSIPAIVLVCVILLGVILSSAVDSTNVWADDLTSQSNDTGSSTSGDTGSNDIGSGSGSSGSSSTSGDTGSNDIGSGSSGSSSTSGDTGSISHSSNTINSSGTEARESCTTASDCAVDAAEELQTARTASNITCTTASDCAADAAEELQTARTASNITCTTASDCETQTRLAAATSSVSSGAAAAAAAASLAAASGASPSAVGSAAAAAAAAAGASSGAAAAAAAAASSAAASGASPSDVGSAASSAVKGVGASQVLDLKTMTALGPQRDYEGVAVSASSQGNAAVPAGARSTREELMDTVSSYRELQSLAQEFRAFADSASSFPSQSLGSTNPSIRKEITVPNGSVNVYYSWTVENFEKGKFLILMLKFTASSGEMPTDKVNYVVTIKNGSGPMIQKGGTTFNGEDMQIIDENSLHNGIENNAPNYDMSMNIIRFNDNPISEQVLPIRLSISP
jgi:hypothetical protein